jgi:uncharacterized damage-inducible protein DinB
METETQHIAALLEQTFQRGAWHGPSVKEVLEKVSGAQAYERLPNTHSIIELVAHMASWRIYVVRKLAGDELYTVSEEQNFPALRTWETALRELDESQTRLMVGLRSFQPARLHEQVPGVTAPLTFYTLLHSIIHHDMYHTGQIMLIQKATSTQSF